jgi:hypothetical protein
MSLRGAFLFFATKQSHVSKEVASPLGLNTPFAKTAQGYSTSVARNDIDKGNLWKPIA